MTEELVIELTEAAQHAPADEHLVLHCACVVAGERKTAWFRYLSAGMLRGVDPWTIREILRGELRERLAPEVPANQFDVVRIVADVVQLPVEE